MNTYGYGFDWTYILVLIGIGLTMLASASLKSTYARYSKIASVSGLTGREVAVRILQANGIYDVSVEPIAGNLTDHYNPATKTVSLSEGIYKSNSIAAIAVAAHECGHAIQDNVGYIPLNLRSALVPVANFGGTLSWPMVLFGIILGQGGFWLINIGIILFMASVLFQIVTLPVEFNASSRALAQLKDFHVIPEEEENAARKVLFAAALTYVAAAAASLLQMLRLIFISRRRR